MLSLGVVACLVAGIALIDFANDLPHPSTAISVKRHDPLRVYSADHKLIGVYGKQKRILIEYANIPKRIVKAFVAVEDKRFFNHPGV